MFTFTQQALEFACIDGYLADFIIIFFTIVRSATVEFGKWQWKSCCCKKKKKILHRPRSIAWELIPFVSLFEPLRVKPIYSGIQPKSAGWLAPLTASAFNQLGRYANSSDNRAYCYTELAIPSQAIAVTIASTHFTYPWRDGWVGLDAWLSTKMVYPRMVTCLSTNLVRCKVTLCWCKVSVIGHAGLKIKRPCWASPGNWVV